MKEFWLWALLLHGAFLRFCIYITNVYVKNVFVFILQIIEVWALFILQMNELKILFLIGVFICIIHEFINANTYLN